MHADKFKRVWRALLAGIVVFVAGCGSMKPLPSDTFYRLDVANAAASGTWTNAPVRVAKFAASGVHRERPIAYTEADAVVVKQHRYHLWIDSPERMLQDELVSYLRGAAVAPIVTGSKIRDHAIEVRGRIGRMDRVADADNAGVVIELHLELLVRGDEDRLVLGREYRETRSAGDDMGTVAGAMSDAVSAIFAQFTADAANALNNTETASNVSHRLED